MKNLDIVPDHAHFGISEEIKSEILIHNYLCIFELSMDVVRRRMTHLPGTFA